MVSRAHARWFLLSVFSLFFFIGATSPRAQGSRPSITGRVLDENDAVVNGARVTLRQARTEVELTATTDAGGAFVFDELAPGEYTVSAAGTGFSAAAQTLAVASGEQRSVNLVLRAGSLVEEVVVSSSYIAGTPEVVERTPGSVTVLGQ